MAAPNLGYGGGSVGVGVETVWGTPVSRTHWLYVRRCNVRRMVAREMLGMLGVSGASDMFDRYTFRASDYVQGEIEWDLAYDDATLLMLSHAMGVNATTGTASPYTHTMQPANPGDWPVGLTIERIFGLRGTTKDAEVYSGCVPTGFTLTQERGQVARLVMPFIGKVSAGRTTAGTPSHHTGEPAWVLHHQCGNLDWSDVDDAMQSYTLTYDRALAFRQLLGSLNGDKPYPTGKSTASLAVVREYDETTAYGDYLDSTESDAQIVYTGSGDNSLTIDLHNAQIHEYDDPVDQPGITTQSMTLRGKSDGTNRGLKLTFTNGNATLAN